MKQIIPVFFTIDDLYAPYLDVALLSLIENASPEYEYRIHVVYSELSEENQQKLKTHEKEGFSISFAHMQKGLEHIQNRGENLLRCDYFTLTIYLRLFLAEMFPQYDKGIYLDSDIVVPGDISRLYSIELGDNLIGACADHSVSDVPPLARYMEESVGVNRYKYINSGVLLMNFSRLREVGFSGRFLSLLDTYHIDCIAPDQDYLNAMCQGHILYLDACWDTMPAKDKPPVEHPQLIHYNLFDKPWCYDGIQYEEYFWSYAKRSAYYDEIKAHKEGYDEEKQLSDRKSLELMLSKAESIPDNENTFRKLHERGVGIRVW